MENEEDTEHRWRAAAPYANGLIAALRTGHTELRDNAPVAAQLPGPDERRPPRNHLRLHRLLGRAPNIVDQLEAAGISWKAYLEDAPAPCFEGAGAGGYAKKHNPFIYYDDIAGSPRAVASSSASPSSRCDLRRGQLPTYAWITPNLCDDGHDCGVAGGDRFLARTVPSLLRELGPHGFLVLTWDEGTSDARVLRRCRPGRTRRHDRRRPRRAPRRTSATPVDHYGVLGTIEQALGLPSLAGATDPRNGRLTALFTHPPHIR